MATRVSVIQGASRGLGLEFARQLLARPGLVVATCRTPSTASDLRELQEQYGDRLHVMQLDTHDEKSIELAAADIGALTPHVNLLLNVSGVLHVPGVMSPETALKRVTLESLERAFRTNTFGPILTCKALAPLLINAEATGGATAELPAVVANFSARVGSISDNRLGGWYTYRSSKAALNQLTKTMALELARKNHKVAAVLLHPGTADTELTRPYQKNVAPEKLFTRERAVSQLLGVLDALSVEDNGRYIAWDGSDIPW